MRPLLLAACLAASMPANAGPVERRIYPAPTTPLAVDGLPDASLISVTTADGLTLRGIEVPPKPGMPILLGFHGNGSSAATMADWFAPLLAAGYGLIAADYRGYSGNPGSPSEAGLAADADAFLAFAETRADALKAPVWVVGHSLGGGVALGLSRRHRLQAVITIGAFTRLRDAAPKLARAFVPDAYRNTEAVAALDEPYFLIHGTADDTVPADQGSQLHDAAGAAGRRGASFVIVGADHRPDAALLLPIFATIGKTLSGGSLSAASLPDTVRLVPFGQRKPLDR